MPAPARTSLAHIVEAGRLIVHSQGVEGLTMGEVAKAVGVRGPSLYKHVANRGELIHLIAESVTLELGERLDAAIDGEDPLADLRSLAHVFRKFSHEHPEWYRLIFAPMPTEWQPAGETLARASRAMLITTEALAGREEGLEAARTVTAWAHGFLTMELAGAFRLDGDLDDAFDYGIERLGAAITRR
jgi:AcrR family transcriptional regulator